MPQDIHGQYSGTLLGKDRIGHTSPDAEASEMRRPYLPVSYPAPWLPGLRTDDGHPIHAQVVISNHMLVGLDKSGALVPAGIRSGNTGNNAGAATGAGYCAIKYSAADAAFGVLNPLTGAVVTANLIVYIAAPDNGADTDVITFPDGSTDSPSAGEITAAKACNLIPGDVAKPIGVAPRPIWQYLGATKVSSTTNGILYTLDGVLPIKWKFHGYMNEGGVSVEREFYLRLPWIGDDAADLDAVATALTMTGYVQGNYSRSFVHMTGAKGAPGLHLGGLVRASDAIGDFGHYVPFDPATEDISLCVGRILGIQEVYPAKDYLNRVKTLWDNSRLGGVMTDPNPASIMMGGSQTAGIDWQLNLSTNGLLKAALDQGKTPDPKMYTYVYVAVRCF